MFTPFSPSPETILETRRTRIISPTGRDMRLFSGWGPRMIR